MSSSKFLAYGPERHGVETVMRMHSVKRWHMIDTTRIQTLAEHSANVAMLAYLIARTAPINYLPDSCYVAAAALVHDVEEAFTGDIPTHTKQRLSGLTELESEVIDPTFSIPVDPNTKMLIKLCDLADGIRFIRIHGVDMTAVHARMGLEKQLNTMFSCAGGVLEWPSHLVDHVRGHVMFYAYETR
jgi:hypothetical protein